MEKNICVKLSVLEIIAVYHLQNYFFHNNIFDVIFYFILLNQE